MNTATEQQSRLNGWGARRLCNWLALSGFFLAIAGVPVLQLICDLRDGGPAGVGVPQVLGIRDTLAIVPELYRDSEGTIVERALLVNQELQSGLQDYEAGLGEFTWLRHPARPLQHMLSLAFRRGSEQVLEGPGGWLFLMSELQSLTAGPIREFAGRRDPGTGRAVADVVRDPLPAIVQFQRLLRQQGVTLLLVPIPAKAAVHVTSLTAEAAGAGERADVRIVELLRELAERGVWVVDLLPELQRAGDPGSWYCRSDTHLNGDGIGRLAEVLAAELVGRGLCEPRAGVPLSVESREVELTGDLARMLDPKTDRREVVRLDFVTDPQTGAAPPGAAAAAAFPAPPILLLGDSHVLVYDADDLHAVGAGLPQQLARHLDAAIETLGVRGSGGTGARLQLLQMSDRLSSLRVVVWCFAARELTESAEGWPVVNETIGQDGR